MVRHTKHFTRAFFDIFVDEEKQTLAWESSKSHGDYAFVEAPETLLLYGLSDDVSDADILFTLEAIEELVLLEPSPDSCQRVKNHASKESTSSP